MSELTSDYLLDQQRQLNAAESRRKISAYILGLLQHEHPGGFSENDNEPEGKNT